MDTQAIARVVLETLRRIAPEVEPEALRRDVPLRQQVDLDSMDWLGFLAGLHRQLGVDIPEADYAKLTTLDDLVTYLAARVR
jgi:acyl carrier protein